MTYTTPLSRYCDILISLREIPLTKRAKQHPPLTATQRLLCRDLARNGKSQRDIAKHLKVPFTQVKKATCGAWAIRRFELTEAEYRQALDTHESGYSWADIAAAHKVGETTFRARIKEWDARVKSV